MIQYYFQINPPSVNVSIQTDSEFANQSMCYLKTKTNVINAKDEY